MLNKLNRYKYSRAEVARAIKGDPVPFMASGLFSVRKGKLYATVNGVRLKVIPNEDRDALLRDLIYTPGKGYPFGRDSLFAILKKDFLNISKRDIETFLKKQKVLVTRRSRPPFEKRGSVRRARNPGILSIDLVHIRAKDFQKLFGKIPGSKYMPGAGQHDRYFLNSVDMLTGYLLSDVIYGKTVDDVYPKLVKQLDRFEELMGRKVVKVEFDKGKEFMGKIIPYLEKRKIRRVMKVTNATVESKNAHMQRNFWAVVEQKRTGFTESVKESVKITNNTLNRTTGLSPRAAMKLVRQGNPVPLKRVKAAPATKKKAHMVGTWVRGLRKKRGKHVVGFKRYKGLTFGAAERITKIRYYGPYPKYKAGPKWYFHDQVIKVGEPTDPRPQIIAKRLVQLGK